MTPNITHPYPPINQPICVTAARQQTASGPHWSHATVASVARTRPAASDRRIIVTASRPFVRVTFETDRPEDFVHLEPDVTPASRRRLVFRQDFPRPWSCRRASDLTLHHNYTRPYNRGDGITVVEKPMKKSRRTKHNDVCASPLSLKERPLLSPIKAGGLAAVFKVLANDSRLRLLHALVRADELCVTDLAASVGMKPQAVSNQLQRLSDLGILSSRREGTAIFYRVEDQCVQGMLEQGWCLMEETGNRSSLTERSARWRAE